MSSGAAEPVSFSLVQGGPFYALRKAMGILPGKGFGLLKRVLIVVGITWLPIAIGSMLQQSSLDVQVPDPLLRHFGIHARFLLALPLFISGEALMEGLFPTLIGNLVASHLIDEETIPAFRRTLHSVARVRDSNWGTFVVLAAIAGTAVFGAKPGTDEFSWALLPQHDNAPYVSLAGWWFLFVARPLFIGYLVIWFWRLSIAWLLMARISSLPLRLVPSHPDRSGGLGFLEMLSLGFTPVAAGLSMVLSGGWAHQVLYHSVHVKTIQPLAIAFLILNLILFVGPLAMFSRSIRRIKRRSLLQYGNLIGEEGRLIHRKWIEKQPVGDAPLLNAPEIGAMADAITLFAAVEGMRPIPIGKRAITPILLAAGLPVLVVFALEIPIGELLMKLAVGLV